MNTCIKMSAFACLHPRPRYPPSGLPRPTHPPFSYHLSVAIPVCLYADVPRRLLRRRRHRRACARRENVFGSGTCQPNVNLSGTSRNDYAHDLHRRAAVQSCICAATGSTLARETVGAEALSLKELRTLFSDTDSCDFSPWNCLSVPSTRSHT